ncbi:MAG: hypothetical protein WAV51_04855 [Microgenomates group bacterium]
MNTRITTIKQKVVKLIVYLLLQCTKPVVLNQTQYAVSFCSMVSHNHLLLYIVAIKSFTYWSHLHLPTMIIDDGTLTAKDRTLLTYHLKNCLVISKKTADKTAKQHLHTYPHCLTYRLDTTHDIETHNQKLFDPFLLCKTDYFILLDSDVIFFSRPTAIIDWIKSDKKHIAYMQYDPLYIQTCNTWGMLTMKVFAKLAGNPSAIKLNSGLICGKTSLFSLAKAEQLCASYFTYKLNRTWLGDQPILAQMFLSEKKSVTKKSGLPSDTFCVLTDDNMRKNLWKKVCIHYHTGINKYVCFVDSVTLLIQTRLFTKEQKIN